MKNTENALNDLASFASTAMGAVKVASAEAKTAAGNTARTMLAELDLADKDTLEIVKEMAANALDRIESLEARLEKLESRDSS